MAKTKTARSGRRKAVDALEIECSDDEAKEKTLARVVFDPGVRHAQLAGSFASQVFGKGYELSIMDSTEVLAETLAKAEVGDKRLASRLLASQAVSLDAMFTELARRSAMNMGDYPDAMDRYMRLALKAQTNCRGTLDALAKLHQPREQIVKHVHVNEGGQAVVADQFHQHEGGKQNAKSDKQCRATGAAGPSATLPSSDAQGNGVPIASGERTGKVQDARRD